MNVVIMGCGRVGAMVALTVAAEGHTVTVLDSNEENLRRIPDSLGVTTLLGDGTLEQDLLQSGIEAADMFIAVEIRDARNALAAQKVRFLFNTPKIVCHINDPIRQEMYQELGLEAMSPTKAVSAMILDTLHR